MLYLALVRLEVVPDPGTDLHLARPIVGTFVITLALGMAVGSCFEIYEWTVNRIFTHALGTGYQDTVGDLALDAVGALGGGALLALWTHRRWPTRRASVRALAPQP